MIKRENLILRGMFFFLYFHELMNVKTYDSYFLTQTGKSK